MSRASIGPATGESVGVADADRSRPHPFELIFAEFRGQQFPAIRAELGDGANLDSFVLSPAALDLMGQLRPDEGVGDGMDDFVALVHAAYLFWRDGERTLRFDAMATRALCAPGVPVANEPLASGLVRYIQLAPQLIWGRLAAEGPFEPLDGWFAMPSGGALRMIACLGVHPGRPGVSVVVVEGPPPIDLTREDGTPLFAPTMSGGDLAGLYAVGMAEELLVLGFRASPGEEES